MPGSQRSPSVSVVIPTRDRPVALRHAVEGVLRQDYDGSIECLVVYPAGAEPASLEVGGSNESRTMRVFSNENAPGANGQRNTGISHASGSLIAMCDDDDEWLPRRLAAQVAALAGNPDALMACGAIIVVSDDGRRRLKSHRDDLISLEDLMRNRIYAAHTSTFLIRREAIHRVGTFDEQAEFAQDYDFLLRVAHEGPILFVRDPVAVVHRHAGSYFADWELVDRGIEYLLSKHPELASDPAALSRLLARRAFANASLGRLPEARRLALAALRLNLRNPRALLALVASARPEFAGRINALAARMGRSL